MEPSREYIGTEQLFAFFKNHPSLALGFSGGCDSSYLLYAACAAGVNIRAFYIKTAFQPQFELDHARRLASELKTPLDVIEVDILSHDSIAKNPADRCYHCKKHLFGLLAAKAAEAGFSLVIDGTNASDDADDRPGMKAIKELSVRSPLRECGITKTQVREFSRRANLFTWNKPAYACLATRISTETPITADSLFRIENAENVLFDLGFTDFRVRVFYGVARLQFTEKEIEKAAEMRAEIQNRFKPFFKDILLDFAVR